MREKRSGSLPMSTSPILVVVWEWAHSEYNLYSESTPTPGLRTTDHYTCNLSDAASLGRPAPVRVQF